MAEPTLTPVDFDPFASQGAQKKTTTTTPTLTPVQGNPFEQKTPVENDEEKSIFHGLPGRIAESIRSRFPDVEKTDTSARKYRNSELSGLAETIDLGKQNEAERLRKKAANLERLRIENPYMAEIIEDLNPLEGLAIGYQSGLRTVGRGVGLTGDETESNRKAERMAAEYGPDLVKVGKFAGEAAPFVAPGMAASNILSMPVRAGVMSAIGGAEGGAIASGEGGGAKEVVLGTLIGSILGGGSEVVVPFISRYARRLAGVDNAVDADGNVTQEFVEALQREGIEPDDFAEGLIVEARQSVNPREAAREAILQSEGVQPTRAQVTRDAADFQRQQEAAKTSGRVREALEEQDRVLTTRFQERTRATGGTASNEESSVTNAILNKANVLDGRISELYKQARENASGEQVIRFDRLATKLKDLATDNQATDGAIKSIMGDLRTRGIVDKKGRIQGRVSVDIAEEVRKGINNLYDPAKPYRNLKLREIKEVLDDDVFRAAGGDIFSQARQAKADFESELTRAKVSKFDNRRANLVRDVLENKIDPDRLVEETIFSKKWRHTDLEQLRDYIQTDEAGQQAFNNLRAETMQEIQERAFISAEDKNGFKTLSRDKLEKALDQIGDKKLRVLFTDEEFNFLKRILSISKIREPVSGTALGKGPSAQAILSLEKKLKELPVVGALVNFIDVDAQGRIALRARPAQIAQPAPGNEITSAAGVSGVVLANQSGEDDAE